MRKKLNIFLSLIVSMVVVLSSTIFPIRINASNIPSENCNIQVTIQDQTGKMITEDTKTYTDQTYTVSYSISIPDNVNIKAGDTMEIPVPKNIKLPAGYNGNIKDANGNVVGTFSVAAGTNSIIKIVFNNYFQDHPLNKNIKLSFIASGTDKPYHPGEDTDLKKLGSLLNNPDGSFSGHIQWTTQYNINKNKLSDITFEDTPQKGNVYDEGSLKILDKDTNEYISPLDVNYDGHRLTFKVPNTSHTLLIMYTTSITDYSVITYKNVIQSTQTLPNGKVTTNVDSAKVKYYADGEGDGSTETSSTETSSTETSSSEGTSTSSTETSSSEDTSTSSTETSSSEDTSTSSTETSSSEDTSTSSTEASSSEDTSTSSIETSSSEDTSTSSTEVSSSEDTSTSSTEASSSEDTSTNSTQSSSKGNGMLVFDNNDTNSKNKSQEESVGEDTTLPQTGNKKSPLLIVMGIILVLLVALLGYKFIIKK